MDSGAREYRLLRRDYKVLQKYSKYLLINPETTADLAKITVPWLLQAPLTLNDLSTMFRKEKMERGYDRSLVFGLFPKTFFKVPMTETLEFASDPAVLREGEWTMNALRKLRFMAGHLGDASAIMHTYIPSGAYAGLYLKEMRMYSRSYEALLRDLYEQRFPSWMQSFTFVDLELPKLTPDYDAEKHSKELRDTLNEIIQRKTGGKCKVKFDGEYGKPKPRIIKVKKIKMRETEQYLEKLENGWTPVDPSAMGDVPW